MARTPPNVTQADIARAIRAAKQTGAAEVEVRVGEERIIIRISPRPDDPEQQPQKIVL
jgi:hypothetical protein